jgi:hypothetical protein
MANQHKEKQRCVRGIPQNTWDTFEKFATAVESDRSRLVHAFIRWFNREPGAKLPKRPLHVEDGSPAAENDA